MAAVAFIWGATAREARGGAPVAPAAGWSFPWTLCIVVIVLLLAVFLVLALLRRFVLDGAGRAGQGMSMEELERLREQGLISREEYRRARLLLMPGVGEPGRSGDRAVDPDPPDATGAEADEP